MPTNTLLEEAIDAWGDARQGVIAEARNIPPGAFAYRPTPEARSVAELVTHIIDTGLMWSNELTRPTADFTRKSFPTFIKHYASRGRQPRSKTDLLSLLKSSHRTGVKQICEAGEVGMLQHVRRFDGERGTRLTWMHHGIAHEEYHRAQIALYARLLGRTPALTRLIEGG